MYSRVEKMIPNEEIKFLHLGEIYEGIEVPQDWERLQKLTFLKKMKKELY